MTTQLHPYYPNSKVLAGIRMFAIAAKNGFIQDEAFNMQKTCVTAGDTTWKFVVRPGLTKAPACGTVACIGGWTAMLMGMDRHNASNFVSTVEGRRSPLRRLFYPQGKNNKAWKMTLIQAGKRAEAFLRKHG